MSQGKLIAKITDEFIANQIITLRGKKVMIDSDLAKLYGVSTKRLNEQVKRNLKRFPEDFMFRINREEKKQILTTFVHLNNLKFQLYFQWFLLNTVLLCSQVS